MLKSFLRFLKLEHLLPSFGKSKKHLGVERGILVTLFGTYQSALNERARESEALKLELTRSRVMRPSFTKTILLQTGCESCN